MHSNKNFLNLPKTKFSMKANLAIKELKILDFWNQINVYYLANKKKNKKKKYFFLHDGPPYANGKIHIGHAVNKILKDIILKYKRMSGFYAPYIPCWDCHGLPIELQIEEKLRNTKIRNDQEFRNICQKYVETQIFQQKNDFIRLGVLADWENIQTTMQYKNEANTIKTLSKILKKGYIYKDFRPIYWCLNCKSSLAEAEVEYINKNSLAIYTNFKLINSKELNKKHTYFKNITKNDNFNISIIVFTTTIWTLPTCQAIAVNPNFTYQVIEINYEYYVLAKKLVKTIMQKKKIKTWKVISEILGKQLVFLECINPVFKYKIPIILSDHVTLEIGTGVVHMSPDHGPEDFIACKKYKINPTNTINSKGEYKLPNFFEINKKNIMNIDSTILNILKTNNTIYYLEKIKHKYPHCWRHKTPIIFRATPQWFIKTSEKKLKKNILREIDRVTWIPHWGAKKMTQMIINRPDWCISRQRKWGVPIMFIIHKETGKLYEKTFDIIKNLLSEIEKKGSQIWWQLDLKTVIKKNAHMYEKVTDILDVWFESGANHQMQIYKNNTKNENKVIADLYLEGSDQHRGWFMSSLIISSIINEHAPYNTVMTHGFVVDEKKRKMSKSLKNSIKPSQIIKKLGADILRLWAAYTNYSGEISISEKIIQQTTDHYRKIRNTIRFLLSNLFDYDPKKHTVHQKNMLFLDKWILEKTKKYQIEILKDYKKYNFHDIVQKIIHFCSIELGSKYLELIKDRLYILHAKHPARRSSQTTIYYILQTLVRLIAPILSFTSDEIWNFLPENLEKSVFLSTWFQKIDTINCDIVYNIKFWEKVFSIRHAVNKKIENMRINKIIGNSLETIVILYINQKLLNLLLPMKEELKFFFSTSQVKLKNYILYKNVNKEYYLIKNFKILIKKHPGKKCNRCWNYTDFLSQHDTTKKNICNRCLQNLKEPTEKRKFL